MIFYALIVLIIFIAFTSAMLSDDYYRTANFFITLFLGGLCLGSYSLLASIPFSDEKTVSSIPITGQVIAIRNPNGGQVYTFVAGGHKYGMDEGGDNVSVEFSNKNTFEKRCSHSFKILVPWTTRDCSYVLSVPSVNAP